MPAPPPTAAQAHRGEVFTEDEPATAPAGPHALSERPPRPTNPPPPDEGDRPSRLELERRAIKAELRAEEAQAAQLERATAEVVRPLRRRAAIVGLIKLVAGITALVGACTLFLRAAGGLVDTIRRAEDNEAKSASAASSAQAAVSELTSCVARMDERRRCIDRQVRDALERGTGRQILALPRGGTDWAQQGAPPVRAPTTWDVPPWHTTEVCPDDPKCLPQGRAPPE